MEDNKTYVSPIGDILDEMWTAQDEFTEFSVSYAVDKDLDKLVDELDNYIKKLEAVKARVIQHKNNNVEE